MTFLPKPKLHHPELPTNALGFTRRDYEGAVSTLCAGCGHDSISAAIVRACFELDAAAAPHRQAVGHRLLVEDADLFPRRRRTASTRVHGRMPSVLTGANLANRDLIYLGVSGDGDSASIGLGQFAHCDAARREHGLHRREQRRVRADQGPVLRHLRQGREDRSAASSTPTSRSTWSAWRCSSAPPSSARSFSGDKAQLVPLIKAALKHDGAAFIDCISPCVAFNNHEGSTKSFDYVREHNEAVNCLDVITGREEITADYAPGTVEMVTQHDGSMLRLRKLHGDYDPHDRVAALTYHAASATRPARSSPGCCMSIPNPRDMHAYLKTSDDAAERALTRRSCAPGRRRWKRSTRRCAEASAPDGSGCERPAVRGMQPPCARISAFRALPAC